MEDLKALMDLVFTFFRRKFTIYGFELSFWDIFIWLFVASLIFWAIKEIFE